MQGFLQNRQRQGLSQRSLAKKAGISYKSLQLIESGRHNPELATIKKLASALGYPVQALPKYLNHFFQVPVDSISIVSLKILRDGKESWKTHLFDFVDNLRKNPDPTYFQDPPESSLSQELKALIASSVEVLCVELSLSAPWWCDGVAPVENPWFVSGRGNLKAMALAESPGYFRKRNIFVLGNFLSRA
ncbi:MAG: helix-turn-helix transcriptional regulator [Deltaproteobacteria bacterium]|nr:MAG: helix-turn-helix transcriptional regulator [Deltaproteobacteria bacterium]